MHHRAARVVDGEFRRRASSAAYDSYFRYAPKEVRECWADLTERANNGEKPNFSQALSVVERGKDESLSGLCDVLARVSPEAALWLLPGELPHELSSFDTPSAGESISLSKGAWLVGTYGQGDATSKLDAYGAFQRYAKWQAARLIHGQVRSLQASIDAGEPVTVLGDQIVVSRLVEPETRMAWISDEISLAVGRWVDKEARGRAEDFGHSVMLRISGNLQLAQQELSSSIHNPRTFRMRDSFSGILTDGLPEWLIENLTARPSVPEPSAVEAVLTSDYPALHPFVSIRGVTKVLNRSAWLLERDDAFLRLAMRQCPRNDEGRPLEAVSASLLSQWGPTGVSWQSPARISPRGASSAFDEVDILGCSDETAFIGECKANRLPEKNASLDVTFQEKIVEKAADQLDTRMKDWSQGWRPKSGCRKDIEPEGFIVTLSSYSGGVWQSPALTKDGEVISYGVFPVHALVLAASVLRSAAQLAEYLRHRAYLLTQGLTNSDELEPLLSYVQSTPGFSVSKPQAAGLIFNQYELSEKGVLYDPRAAAVGSDWKGDLIRTIWLESQPVIR